MNHSPNHLFGVLRAYCKYKDARSNLISNQRQKTRSMIQRISLLLFSTLVILSSIQGQIEPVSIQIMAAPPYPTLLSAYENKADDLLVTLRSNDPANDQRIRLTGSIRGDNGISVVLPADYIPGSPIVLAPLEVRVMSLRELSEFYPGLGENDLVYSGGPSREELVQSQRIPDGNYQICLQALQYDTGVPLSSGAPLGCSGNIFITTLEPPLIMTPSDGDEVDRNFPPMINFSWTPVVGAMVPISYNLIIAEVPAGVNPYDAIETQNLRIYDEEDLMVPVFIYDESYPPLIDGKRYAVRVQAIDETASVTIRKEGWSEVNTFTYTERDLGGGLQRNLPAIPNFNCMDACVGPNLSNLPSLDFLNSGDTIRIGYFDVEIDQAVKNGPLFSGTGKVLASSFIPVDLAADFNDLAINESGMVTSGAVKTAQMGAAAGLEWLNNYKLENAEDEEQLEQVFNTILDPDNSISTALSDAVQGAAIELPISIGVDAQKIHITEIEFSPSGAIGKMMSGYKMWGDHVNQFQNMVFANDAVCITPGGLAGPEGSLKMDLLQSISFAPSEVYTVAFDANESGIDFDCEGIQQIRLNGHVAFNRAYALPENGQGEIAPSGQWALAFDASFPTWDALMFEFQPGQGGGQPDLQFTSHFQLPALEQFTFSVEDIVLDLSDGLEHPNVRFPDHYGAGPDWTGFYIENVKILFPPFFEKNGERAFFDGHNLIIDDGGFSGAFSGRNIIENGSGYLGGWGFSLDRFQMDLQRNNLEEVSFEGGLLLPIADTYLDYTGEILTGRGGNEYRMNVGLQNQLDVPLWYSSIQLDESSNVQAEVINNEVRLEAVLHGTLSFDDEIGEWGDVDIQNIRFEDLTLRNQAPFVEGGEFDLNNNLSCSFMGFDVGLEGIELSGGQGGPSGSSNMDLGLDLRFQFGDIENGFSAMSELNFNCGKVDLRAPWTLGELSLSQIHIEGEISVVSVDGWLENFVNDPVMGSGFRGGLDAVFLDDIDLHCEGLFGSKSNYDFWYFDGNAQFDNGIDFAPPMALHGFGGGAYYNMNSSPSPRAVSFGAARPMSSYVPSEGGWGFKARTVLGVRPEPEICNGTVDMEVEFGRGGSFSRLLLAGDMTMMDAPVFDGTNVTGDDILLSGELTYNRASSVLGGNLGYRLNVPSSAPMIVADDLSDQAVSFHFGGLDDWNVQIGDPTNMIGFRLQLPMRICGDNIGLGFGAQTYFVIGSEIPGIPPIPNQVLEHTGGRRIPRGPLGDGVGFGIHGRFGMSRVTLEVLSFGVYFTGNAGLGLDVSIMKNTGLLCNGLSDYGINGWRAAGQAYVYGNLDFGVTALGKNFRAARVGFGAFAMMRGPNPTYIAGRIGVSVDLPLIGDYNFNRGFSIGNDCRFTEDERANMERLEEQAEELTLITRATRSTPDDVSYFDRNAYADFHFYKQPEWPHRFEHGRQVLTYKIQYTGIVQEMNGDQAVRNIPLDSVHHLFFRGSNILRIWNYNPEDGRPVLDPGRDYRIVINAALVAHEGYVGTYQAVQRNDGSYVRDQKIIEFSTISRANLKIENVISVVPRPDEKYFHHRDHNDKMIVFSDPIRDNLGPDVDIDVVFTNVRTMQRYVSHATISKSRGVERIRYGFPFAHEEPASYRMDIWAKWQDGTQSRLYHQFFTTSKYDRLSEKVDALSIRPLARNAFGVNGPNYHITLEGDEGFDLEHENVELQFIHHGRAGQSSWQQDYRRLHVLSDSLGAGGGFNIAHMSAARTQFNRGRIGGRLPVLPVGLTPRLVGLNPMPNNGVRPVLQFTWYPNDYIAGLRNGVIQSLGKAYNPLTSGVPSFRRIPEDETVTFSVKGSSRHVYKRFEMVRFN